MVARPLVNGRSRDRDGRAGVLAAVANALRGAAKNPLPPEMRAFDDDGARDRAALAASFKAELERLGGEVRCANSVDERALAVAEYVAQRGLTRIGAQDDADVRFALSRVPETSWFVAAGLDAHAIDAADAGVLRASTLLADTGSAIVVLRDYAERLLQYMPRTCLIVAGAAQLHPHLGPSSMAPVVAAARAGGGGEATIVTGPSRTTDIEKTLVLGAHGPQSVVVFLLT